MQKYWLPFAADAAYGAELAEHDCAEHDCEECYSIAWHGSSQVNPYSDDGTMDTL